MVILEGVFDPVFIQAVQRDYLSRYSSYLGSDTPHDVFHVGEQRWMIPVEISGIYNQPYLYANSLVFNTLQGLLGQCLIMAGFGSVTSLTGANQQCVHRDHDTLFGDADLEHNAPPFALTVVIPLVDLNGKTGSTRFYPGTHRMTREKALYMAFVDPDVQVGSCVIWDYLVFHSDMPNRSLAARPLMYFSYSRGWFRDSLNYSSHEPIQLTNDEYMKMPEGLRPLFSWAVRPSD